MKQLAAINQIKYLSKFSLVTTFVGPPKMIKAINEMFCNQEFAYQNE